MGTFNIFSGNVPPWSIPNIDENFALCLNTSGGTPMTGVLDTGAVGQVQFPATQNPSSSANCLDDYEEGVFSPTFSVGSGSVTFNNITGTYTKIGNRVCVEISIYIATASSPTGNITIGLPFTSENANVGAAVHVAPQNLLSTATSPIYGSLAPNASYLSIYKLVAGVVTNMAQDLQAGSNMRISVNYRAGT